MTGIKGLHELEIGFSELVATAEERLPGEGRSRVGHAVGNVQGGGMATFAEPRVRVGRALPVKIGEREDLDSGLLKEAKQRPGGVFLEAGGQNQTYLSGCR